MPLRRGLLAGSVLLLALAGPGAAAADESADAVSDEVTTGAPAGAAPAPTAGLTPLSTLEPAGSRRGWTPPAGEAAVDDWQARRPWGWGSAYVFPLTRGMPEAGIPLWGRIPLYPLTVVLDLAQLPAGLIGGLWGR